MRRQWKMRWQSKSSCQLVFSRSIVVYHTNVWTGNLSCHRVNLIYCHRPKSVNTWFIYIVVTLFKVAFHTSISNATYANEMHFISCAATHNTTHQNQTEQLTSAKWGFHVCCNGKMVTTKMSKLGLLFIFVFTAMNSFAQRFKSKKGTENTYNIHSNRARERKRKTKN